MTADAQQMEKIASREATDWFLLLSEEPDDVALRRNFEKWLNHSTVNATAWYAMQQASEAMNKSTPVLAEKWQPRLAEIRGDPTASASVETSSTAPDQSGRGSMRHRTNRANGMQPGKQRRRSGSLRRLGTLSVGAVAVAACLMAVMIVGPWAMRGLQSDYATGTGETRTVVLEDGSEVTLAPESAVKISFAPGQRTVGLLEGEAFFDVSANPERPFVVEAGAVETTVLGTGFDVLRARDGVAVSVEHGQVRVDFSKDGQSSVMATLGAGQSVHVGLSGEALVAQKPPSQIATWRAHQLIARDQPLGLVVDQLRSYYNGKIIVLDEVLSAEPVTGVYNLADPLEALYGIARAQNAELWQVSPWIVIVSR